MYPKVASEVVNNPYASPLSKDHERPQKSVLPIHRARTDIKTNKCPHGNCFTAVNCHQKCPSAWKTGSRGEPPMDCQLEQYK